MLEAAYSLFRADKNTSPEDVRKTYVRLVRRYPPEHFPEKFAEIRKAYQQLTLSDDFVTETFHRFTSTRNFLDMAACLWGDRKELAYGRELELEDLMSLLEREDTRRNLDELLAVAPDEIEWKTGGDE